METNRGRHDGGGVKALVYLFLYVIFSASGGLVAGIGLFVTIEPKFGLMPSVAISSAIGVFTWGTLVIAYLKD